MRRITYLLLLALPAVANADIYKCVNKDGQITYTNIPGTCNKKLDTDLPVNTIAAPPRKASSSGNKSAAGLATPPKAPVVSADTQRRRDDMRRTILQEELANEQNLLKEAKQKLADAEAVRLGDERNYQKFLDRVQPFKDEVTLHEQNIQALQKEIDSLK